MILELDSLSHRYGSEQAVDDVSFGLDPGELVGVLGPSGCGKTTLVQAIAGHVQPTAGRVLLRGEDVTNTPPEARRVGVVFQRSTLYPHMTVGENVGYGLAAQDIESAKRETLVAEYLELVDLQAHRHAHPTELSGGQRRRVELARALAPQPDILVLDEPLSALDRALRTQLRDEIARIQRETGVTTLFVTHDQEEAMALADRLVVLSEGHVEAIGAPRTLYQSPPTPFVASFLGRSNTLSGTVVAAEPLTIAVGENELTLDGNDPVQTLDGDGPAQTVARSIGTPITCHIRPKYVSFRPAGTTGSTPSVPGEVVRISDIGRRYDVTVQIETGETLLAECSTSPPAVGDSVSVILPRDRLTVFDTER